MEFIEGLKRLPEPPAIGLLTGNIRLGAEIKLRHFDLWKEFATGGFADDHEDRDQIAHAATTDIARVARDAIPMIRRGIVADSATL